MDTWPPACGYMATCMWKQCHVYVATQPCAHGYTATCMWIHGHMRIVNNKFCMWIQATCTWIHDYVDTRPDFEYDSYLIWCWFPSVAHGRKPESVQWPTALSQSLRSGPQRFSRLCAVAHSSKADLHCGPKWGVTLKVQYIGEFEVIFETALGY